jgi:hypothetical protein
MLMRRLSVGILLLAAACGSSPVATTSAHLEPLDAADDPYPSVRGERCNLVPQDTADGAVRLVAFRDAAVVRANGAPVRLAFQGRSLPGGGTFSGDGVTVAIGGISPAMADPERGIAVPVVVAVRRGDSVEDFEGFWTCGLMRPEPRAGR